MGCTEEMEMWVFVRLAQKRWRCCVEIKREAKEMEMWVDDLAFEF
jgi:transposase